MLTTWTVICGVLAITALVNLALVLGLVARMRLLETAAAVGSPALRLPELGRTIRPFEITTVSGEPLDAGGLASGTTVVGFFTAGCRKCERIRSALVEAPPALPIVVMINGNPDEPEVQSMGALLLGIGRVAYFEDLTVARAFGVLGYPTLLRVEDGKIAAAGRDLDDIGARA
jgi:thiol-disulfide isomerase/thioredoxin